MPGTKDNGRVALDKQVPLIKVSLVKPNWIAKCAKELGCKGSGTTNTKALLTVMNAEHTQAAIKCGADALLVMGDMRPLCMGEMWGTLSLSRP